MTSRRVFLCGAAGACVGAAVPALAQQENITITLGASHPKTFLPVGVMADAWKKRVDELLRGAGDRYRITWKESLAGTLYKFRETRTALRDGLVDIGWVGTLWESSAMPLSNVAYYTPFATDSMAIQMATMNMLTRTNKALEKEWTSNGMVFLGASAGDTYHLFTKFPVRGLQDLPGRKVSSPGASGNWLKGTGLTAIDSAITNFYTDIQTGITDGAFSFYTGAYPTRIHEVAPHVTEVNAGAVVFGGLAANARFFARLPQDVQAALAKAGDYYSVELARTTAETAQRAKEAMISSGAKVVVLPASDRAEWVRRLPNLSGEWSAALEGKGLPARQLMRQYMDMLRQLGATPARNWTA